MATSEQLSRLRGLSFAASLSEATLARLVDLATEQTFEPGQVIFYEGQQHDVLYVVESGHVALDVSVPGRGSVRILSLGPGDLLGWSALLDEGRMKASATALAPTCLLAAPGAALRALCQQDPTFGYELMRRLADAIARRLIVTRLQLLDLFADTPSEVPYEMPPAGGERK